MRERHSSGAFEQTAEFQRKYESLLSVCQSNGTMISQNRLLEKDVDIVPHRFFRRGTREYIFPKQNVSLREDKSHVIDPSEDYNLRTEEQTFDFDANLVKGTLKIEYEDANNRPTLRVMEDLELPKLVIETIEDVFKN